MPFWDRVQKKKVLKMFFEKNCNRVARSGAAWDPIALLAKEHIGITRYWHVHPHINLEAGLTLRRKKSALGEQMLFKVRRA